MSENRKAYLDWLRNEVEHWCTDEGLFQVEYDHDDRITPDQILDAWEHYKDEGYASPMAYLENETLNIFSDMESYFYDCLLSDLRTAPNAVQDGWDEAQSIWDDLSDVGYHGIDMNLAPLLDQSSFELNLFFATKTEVNLDMGGIVNAFGNDYRTPDLAEEVTPEDADNALSYLINQQGHSITELYAALDERDSGSPLIESVREEIANNSSEAMSELCALVRMNGNQMLDLLDSIEKSKDSLVLPKDYATIGIFNQWSGCGGMLGIKLEQDAVPPFSMVREFSIEGQTSRTGSYTVNEVYGMVGSAWMPNFSYRAGIQPNVKEDYAAALSQAREAASMVHEEKTAKETPISLKNIAKEARESSQALSGNDTHIDSRVQDAR